MNKEDFRRILEKMGNMSDEEFVSLLEDAGLTVEDIPEGDDPDLVLIEQLSHDEIGEIINEYRVKHRIPNAKMVAEGDKHLVYDDGTIFVVSKNAKS